MSAGLVARTRPGWRFWLFWMLATFVGGAVGLLVSFPFQIILETAMGGVKAPPWTATETVLIMVLKGAQGGMMGLGIGLGQWVVFREHLKQTGGWIVATGLALFLQGAFRWSIPYTTPPEQVFLLTALWSGISLGLCQWFVLRGRVPYAGWWIGINIVGCMAELAFHAVSEYTQSSIDSIPGMGLLAISMILPFAVAGAGMVWLLRRTLTASKVIAGSGIPDPLR